MKTIALSIILGLFIFISGCSKDEFLTENNSLSENKGKKGAESDDLLLGGHPNSFYKENLPMLRFNPKEGKENTYTLVLKDPAQTTTVSATIRVRYQDPVQQSRVPVVYEVAVKANDFITQAKVPNVVFPAPVENQIMDMYIEYFEGDVVVKKFEYRLFVFPDGKTALQKPTVKRINWTWEDGGVTDLDEWNPRLTLVVQNDPAEQVASAEVVFDEKTSNPAPITFKNYLKTKTKTGPALLIQGGVSWNANPVGYAYNVTVSLLDKNGALVSEPEMVTTNRVPSKPKPSIHNVYIREIKDANGNLTHQMAALVLNINPERLGYVEINFTDTNFESKPPVLQKFHQMKQRKLRDLRDMQIIYTGWDNIINDYASELQENPLALDNGTEFNPLFEMSAVGYTYTVSATMFDKNGKQIGKPQTFDVTVEGETDKTEPVLLSTRLYSNDGGKTWNYEAVIQDNGQWVEKVQVEFVKPYEGPAPVYNPIGLTLVATKEGNIKMYSGKVEFDGNPAGFIYTAIINQYGTGTRRTANQAGSKAELL